MKRLPYELFTNFPCLVVIKTFLTIYPEFFIGLLASVYQEPTAAMQLPSSRLTKPSTLASTIFGDVVVVSKIWPSFSFPGFFCREERDFLRVRLPPIVLRSRRDGWEDCFVVFVGTLLAAIETLKISAYRT